ncbi:nitrite reductase small subunit NirD [Marinomonas epiphytica]
MQWQLLCTKNDLIVEAGVAAMVAGEQVALFYVPDNEQQVFAVSNWDPIGKANVLSRGLVTHLAGQWSVASPLYKQHFLLDSGECVEEDYQLKTWPIKVEGEQVYIAT